MISAFLWLSFLKHIRGIDVNIESNTSLNEKYNILTDMTIPTGIMPKLKYLGIGVGGIGDPIKTGYHKHIHGSLYEHIPFICRPLTTDLTISEASNYRFRVVQNIGGTEYVFYYLKNIENIADTVNIKVVNKESIDDTDGIVDRFDTDTPEILTPTIDGIVGDLDLTKSTYYITECKIPISLNQEEKDEVINAYSILTGTNIVPNISEMCLYTGLDTVLGTGYTEAYGVRSGVFYPVPYELQPLLNVVGVTQRYIDIGGMRMN